MKLTTEQETIIAAAKEMVAGDIIKIDAAAGAAKTSTLVFIAEAISEPSICLVFNKAAQIDADERFPAHVLCKTTHSLAYSAIGHLYSSKLSRPQGGYVNVLGTGSEIAKHFRIEPFVWPNGKDLPAAFLGLLIRNTVNRFEQSADLKITVSNLPDVLTQITEKSCSGVGKLKKDIVTFAEKLWKLRTDLSSDVLATHDTYLKLYHLSNPKLPYKIIYADEFQDANPCVVDILSKQNAKVVIVGDQFQAIYGWRGAVNALKDTIGKEFKLSTSFRYGQDSADLASKVLEDKVSIKSHTGLHTEIGEDVVDKTKPYTILYRTNQALVLDAVKCIQDGLSVNIEIDVRDFCNLLTSAVALYRGELNKVKHEELLCFNNFGELKEEAEGNGAFNRLVNIIETGKSNKVLNALNFHKNSRNALITFTTAHKAKGREWKQVELADDFPLHIKGGEWVGLSQEEQNLLYVATTRAIEKMNLNKSLKEIWVRDLMDKPKESKEFIEESKIALKEIEKGLFTPYMRRADRGVPDGAFLALERAEIESEQAEAHYNMEISNEEAYDLGILDEMGYANYNLSDLTPH